MEDSNILTVSKDVDNLLIYFPFWFPIIYLLIGLNVPQSLNFLFIGSLFLFAETHFASTWLFFFNKENHVWLRSNAYKVIILPVYLILGISLIWIFSPGVILLIHYCASGWHVTRQSVGITKIAGSSNNFKVNCLYLFSFTCLIWGLYKPGIMQEYLDSTEFKFLLYVLLILYFCIIFFAPFKSFISKIEIYLPLITGLFIYLPLFFFKDIATATALGVGMHWCQYIALIWSINLRKLSGNKKIKRIFIKKNILFIFTYSGIMTTLSFLGMPRITNLNNNYSYLYLIPILFQFYHFYIDGFIWRFSDPHIKKSIYPYLSDKYHKSHQNL